MKVQIKKVDANRKFCGYHVPNLTGRCLFLSPNFTKVTLQISFTLRRYANTVYAVIRCPSALSKAGTAPKRLTVGWITVTMPHNSP